MFDSWVGTIPWRRERLPTPLFWPGEFHGLYSLWGCKESDKTEQLSLSLSNMSQRTYIISVYGYIIMYSFVAPLLRKMYINFQKIGGNIYRLQAMESYHGFQVVNISPLHPLCPFIKQLFIVLKTWFIWFVLYCFWPRQASYGISVL